MTNTHNSTPISCYEADLKKANFRQDSSQRLAVEHLQSLFEELQKPIEVKSGFFEKIFKKDQLQQPIKGLYFWGGVGRGKTYLVDTFYHCLTLKAQVEKKRIHFHVFMQEVHQQLKMLKDKKDPLKLVAEKMVLQKDGRLRVLCFDEFVVADVADAVILGKLMTYLFSMGVTLVATSNAEPKNLYPHGLQRDLLLPAIDLIYQHTDVVNIDGGVDYRLAFLEKADIYFSPITEESIKGLAYNFSQLAPEPGKLKHIIMVLGREIQTKQWADGIVWFEFNHICETARSQNDYIELARRFHTILIEGIPIFDQYKEDSARRLINLVDVLYDHNVKLIISAETTAEQLYIGRNPQVKFEFERTASRLAEMQSKSYLGKAHIS